MDWAKECAVVLPCFNEARTIGSLVEAIRTFLPVVWVLDDGSTDATALLARKAGGRVLRHPGNLGKGVALTTTFTAIIREGFSWALTMDGDGQHAPADIPSLLQRAEQTGAALVVGNRMSEAAAMSWLRRSVNRWMSRRISHRAGILLPDSQCGFRLVSLTHFQQLALQTRHFEVESEMLLAFADAGFSLAFAPVRALPAQRPSRVHLLVDTWRWFYWWWHTSRTHTVARPVDRDFHLVAPPNHPKNS